MVLIIAAVLLTAAGTCLVPAAVSLRMRRLRRPGVQTAGRDRCAGVY